MSREPKKWKNVQSSYVSTLNDLPKITRTYSKIIPKLPEDMTKILESWPNDRLWLFS